MSLLPNFPPALLALANGVVFRGVSIGAESVTSGEVIFNTAMTGYQEILTDPACARQIVTLTYPHIGNTGCNEADFESAANHAAGLVIRDLPPLMSSWRAEETLSDYLKKHGIVAIAGIDTRQLTRILRDQGTQAGCIIAGETDETRALAIARSFPGLSGTDLVTTVTTQEPYNWNDRSPKLVSASKPSLHVVVYDFGIKQSILKMFAAHGSRLTIVPAHMPACEVMALKPDGVFLSNGPGDPAACAYAVEAIRELMAKGIPLFGVGLGHQLLALAVGAKTMKMKVGHHGANHPVKNLDTGQVLITTQSHSFSVDADSLSATAQITHISLFDGSLQGIALASAPAFSFQGHPENSMFRRFLDMMTQHVKPCQNVQI